MICIYKIIFPNNKYYIGQTNNLNRRIKQHEYESIYKRKNLKIYNAIRKYELKNCKIEIVETCNEFDANTLEKFYIKKFNSIENGYNVEIGGNRNFCSGETKLKISNALKGRKKPIRTIKHKKNLSKSLLGKVSPNKGKKLSDLTKQKISNSKKKYFIENPDATEKCKTNLGKLHSIQTKQKISIGVSKALKGKKLSEEHKKKLSLSHIGKIPWNKGKRYKIKSSKV